MVMTNWWCWCWMIMLMLDDNADGGWWWWRWMVVMMVMMVVIGLVPKHASETMIRSHKSDTEEYGFIGLWSDDHRPTSVGESHNWCIIRMSIAISMLHHTHFPYMCIMYTTSFSFMHKHWRPRTLPAIIYELSTVVQSIFQTQSVINEWS